MAGIPTAFGAFAGGLWGGATQFMNLATTFQAYQQNEMNLQLMRDAIAKQQAAQQQQMQQAAAQADLGQRDRERQGYGDQQQPPAPEQPAAPAQTTPSVKTTPAGTRAPTGPAPLPPQAGQPSAAPVDRRETTAAPTTTTRQPPPAPGPAVPTQEEQAAGTGLPLSGTPQPPTVGRVPMVAPAPQAPTDDTTTQQRRQAPISGAPFNAAGVQGMPGTPSGGPAYRPDQNLVSRITKAVGDALYGPSSGFTTQQAPTAAPAQPQLSVTQPVGGYFGRSYGPQTPTVPTGTGQAPVIPPAQTPAVTTPGASTGVARPVPQAQAAPSGGGVLGAIGRALIPSAQAQEAIPPPGVSGGPGLTTTPAPTAPAATSETAGQAAAKQPVTAAATQPVLPAAPTPNYTQVQARRPPATAPVAPEQKGPTVTTTPPPPAPSVLQVDPRPWHTIQLYYPDLAAKIRYAVQRYGHGQVTEEEVAAVKVRESGYLADARQIPDGDGGRSYGAMQVQPGTFAGASDNTQPTGEFDPHTIQGSLNQGVVVLAHVSNAFGAHTVQAQYAYARGDGAARYAAAHGLDAAEKLYPGGIAALEKVYGHGNFSSANFPGPFGNGADHGQIVTDLTRGAAAGPDGALHALARYTPAGFGMSNAWRAAQNAFELVALAKGNYAALPTIQNYFAALSHQGTLSNLNSAYTALASGNPDMAAQYIAKAYGFFPDGVTGRIGVDNSGRVWAQRFDEGTQQPLGRAFEITLDGLGAKIAEAGTAPQQFLAAVMNYRKSAAEIRQLNAHADYFEKMPEVRQAMIEERQRHDQETEQLNREKLEAQEETRQAKGERAADIDKQVAARYGADAKPEGVDDRQWATQSEIARSLQYPEHSGGANLGAPMADKLAGDIRQRTATFRPFMGHDNQGRPVPSIAIFGDGKDPKKDQPDAEVSFEMGRRIMGRAGYPPLVGGQGQGQGMPTQQPPRPQAAVGAGAGSPMVAMGGGFNLAGPVMSQPQVQPQPNAVG